MNLVAKKIVAARDDERGVLVGRVSSCAYTAAASSAALATSFCDTRIERFSFGRRRERGSNRCGRPNAQRGPKAMMLMPSRATAAPRMSQRSG